MIEMITVDSSKVIAFKLSGKLHDADYKTFVPLVDEKIAEQGKARLLIQFVDFQGWDMHALWDDIKFASTHCTTIERVAMVGDSSWEKWMSVVCKPFTMAKVQYFTPAEMDKAVAWVNE